MVSLKLGSKLALCTLSAFIIASLVFLGLHRAGFMWIDNKFQDSAFVDQQQYLELQNLQKHIDNCQASALDYYFISTWVEGRELPLYKFVRTRTNRRLCISFIVRMFRYNS